EGIVARAGGGRTAGDEGVATEEPLAEWERELYAEATAAETVVAPEIAPEVTPDPDIAAEAADVAGEPIEAENVQSGATVAAPPPNPGETSDASDQPANA
ncbi:MAG TPA: 30S ribosomal protein S2, partial [Lapillicoccus sp.]|nr:30S ribosomal protein S2 [Lapillicoccus sp.]